MIFINMKEQHLRIRLSESQMKELTRTIIKNDFISKSEFVRQAITEKIKNLKPNGHQRIK
jgi:metal-responsive CopG/Arc/MetJ family transcriptional regulator